MRLQPDPLSPDQAHLWVVDLDSAPKHSHDELAALLSEKECERAERYAFDEDRRRFVVCRGLLRCALSSYLEVDASDLRFEQNEWGKPFVPKSPLKFNVSHSRGVALLGFTQTHELGVDIEHIDRRVSVLDLAKHCFSTDERNELAALLEDQRLSAFFACWSRKEAYIKARGRGLSLDLRSFDVSIDAESRGWLLKEERKDVSDAWTLRSFSLVPRCASAVAIHAPGCDVSIYRWNWTSQTADKMKLPPLPEGVPSAA